MEGAAEVEGAAEGAAEVEGAAEGAAEVEDTAAPAVVKVAEGTEEASLTTTRRGCKNK